MHNTKPERCGVCGQGVDVEYKEQHKEYSLWECSECKTQFWTPMKNPGASWYEHDERYAFRNKYPLAKPERNHKKFFKDSPEPGRKLIDIGMGTGNFLAAAIKYGYDAYGSDFDKGAIEKAKEFFGLENVFVGDIETIKEKFGEHFFDVATMFEVVEHVESPRAFLESVSSILKPGGYVGISVPYRGYKDSLKPFDKPPRHLTRWDVESMTNVLELAGYNVVRTKIIKATIPFLMTKCYFWTKKWLSFGLVQKTMHREAGKNTKPQAKNIPTKIKLSILAAKIKNYVLFFIPATALFLWLNLTKKGGLGLYVLAQKK
ncbi:MAG: hypothetical protein COU08_01710 [Candidatus Harrisonbacteria bacterium CG10_big_fil_rev_8_21_14_0_10_42_17]|uniref:Methyltransferase type 11 domain-containing protein n=1 Tax=Candidatus Harrisonbacteria bacterium CG10_big_fil_rev_8_21_14_0_10_42_17 TaxID=1974584 RepID=A0A2M6WID0_9BACT|nr:MAG: hypothetical protein COU08_01710 [Candidatus Harrisonbacteria bacterium CG10_big_fil_rev_8_21_14_0_10_42_17]